jgi:hypothetical protein
VATSQTARAGPDAVTSSLEAACLVACSAPHGTDDGTTQVAIASRSASPDAIAAASDLVFEGLIEAGSLAESYSRSLAEAAWRGDRPTVEVHLRQLRACVVASIDIFKRLDGIEPKGAGA